MHSRDASQRREERERAERFAEIRPRVSNRRKEVMLAGLLRKLPLFLEARRALEAKHFGDTGDEALARIWGAALQHYERYQALPGHAELLGALADTVTQDPMGVCFQPEIESLLQWAFTELAPEAPNDGYVRQALRDFLQEQTVFNPLRQLLDAVNGDLPANLGEVLHQYTQQSDRLTGLSTSRVFSAACEEEEVGLPELIPTGIPFLDRTMEGGWAAGECYGLLGCIGSGKTTLMSMIGAEGARVLANRARQRNEKPRFVYHVTYEASRHEIRQLVISYLARIRRDRCRQKGFREQLSTAARPESLQKYELQISRRSERTMGELERLEEAEQALANWRCLDMRAEPGNPQVGTGGVAEIQAILVNHLQEHPDEPPALILIDYAVEACRRFVAAKGWDPSNALRHVLSSYVSEVKNQLAEYFGCGVWIANQLKASANAKSPGAPQSFADSMEAKNFPEGLVFTFQLGTKHKQESVCRMDVGKTRRGAGTEEYSLLRFNSDWAALELVDAQFTIDNGRIADRSAIAPWSGAARAAQRGRQQVRRGSSSASAAHRFGVRGS
jgi:hypothetical protein